MADDEVKAKIEKNQEKLRVVERGQAAAKSLSGPVGESVSSPESKLDYQYWAMMSEWTIDEAAALSLNLPPQEQHGSRRNYVDRRRLLERAVHAGELDQGSGCPRSKFPPVDWADWLKSKGLSLPAKLEELIRKARGPKHQSKTQFSAANVKKLEEEIAQLKGQLSKAAIPPAKQRYNNALLVAYVVAVDAYGHDPDKKRSTLVKTVLDAFAGQNIEGPKDDALRDIFDEASQIAAERPADRPAKENDPRKPDPVKR